MIHRTTPSFWERYRRLPEAVRELADKDFRLLKGNPKHPSLDLKKIGSFRSARVGLAHRPLAVEDGEDLIWVWNRYPRRLRENDQEALIARETGSLQSALVRAIVRASANRRARTTLTARVWSLRSVRPSPETLAGQWFLKSRMMD